MNCGGGRLACRAGRSRTCGTARPSPLICRLTSIELTSQVKRAGSKRKGQKAQRRYGRANIKAARLSFATSPTQSSGSCMFTIFPRSLPFALIPAGRQRQRRRRDIFVVTRPRHRSKLGQERHGFPSNQQHATLPTNTSILARRHVEPKPRRRLKSHEGGSSR
jgi:hypothetical protein